MCVFIFQQVQKKSSSVMGLKIFRLAVNCETMFHFQFWLAEESQTCRRLNDLLYGNKNSLSGSKFHPLKQSPWRSLQAEGCYLEANALAMGMVDNLSRSLPLIPLSVFAHPNCSWILEWKF